MDESDFGSTVYGIIGRSFLENGGDLSGGPDLVHLRRGHQLDHSEPLPGDPSPAGALVPVPRAHMGSGVSRPSAVWPSGC